MTAEEYRALLDVDFNNVKIEDLTDIRKIKIDKNQPQSKRQAQFLKQVGNPYMLRRGSMMIKVSLSAVRGSYLWRLWDSHGKKNFKSGWQNLCLLSVCNP